MTCLRFLLCESLSHVPLLQLGIRYQLSQLLVSNDQREGVDFMVIDY